MTSNKPTFDPDLIGFRLREARVMLVLTQWGLAKLSDVPARLISEYERGVRIPPTKRLYSLCQALRVRTDWVLGLEDGNPFGDWAGLETARQMVQTALPQPKRRKTSTTISSVT